MGQSRGVFVLPCLAVLTTASIASAQPACPDNEKIVVGPIFRPQGSYPPFNVALDLAPCQTVQITLTFTAGGSPDNGIGGSIALWSKDPNATLPLYSSSHTEADGSRTYPGTNGWVPPYPGTRGDQGLPGHFVLDVDVLSSTGGYYTYVIEKVRRPGYNIGGIWFDDAPLISTAPTTYYGSVHAREPGQFYKVHLKQNQYIFIAGEVQGNSGGSTLKIDVHYASGVLIKNLVNFPVGSTLTTIPFNANKVYVNKTGADADFYLRVYSTLDRLVKDFRIRVETPRLTLNPPSPVVRGTWVTLTIESVPVTFTAQNWRYESSSIGTFTRTVGGNDTTWEGLLIDSGNARVDLQFANGSFALSEPITVLPRPFAFIAVPPDKVDNGYNAHLNLPDPPTPNAQGALDLGRGYVELLWDDESEELVDNGPNHGGKWVAMLRDQSDDFIPRPTVYLWVLAPALEQQPPSSFYQAQTGTYNPLVDVSPACSANTYPQQQTIGWIRGATLATNTRRHEIETPSHYMNYKTTQDNPVYNLGVNGESKIAGTAMDLAAFEAWVDEALALRRQLIYNATKVEYCGSHDTRVDGQCVCNGYINPIY